MEFAMEDISKDKTVRGNTVQGLIDFSSHPLATQAKDREQLVSIIFAIWKIFDVMGADIVEFCTENESLENKKLFTMENGSKHI